MKRLKVMAALFLAAATIGGTAASAQAVPYHFQEEINETSLATQAWARSAIHWGFADGLTVGAGKNAFLPDNTISRAEAVTMLTKFKEISIEDYRKESTVFADINGAWYTPYINAAYENAMVAGKGDGIFDPSGTLTRAEAVTMIVKALGYQTTGDAVPFEDINGAWYTGFIKAAYNHSIVAGKSETKFDPNGRVTRAEFMMMLYKAKMSGIKKGMYTAVMIAHDAKSFELAKNGETVLTYNSETKAVTGAAKVKKFTDEQTGSWQMVYFDPMDSFELIPTDDGKICGLRFFANGHEVDINGNRTERVEFTNDKSVISYRDEIGRMYPTVLFSLNPFNKAELDVSPHEFVILTNDGTLLGGDKDGFELYDTKFTMGNRILEHKSSAYVKHSILSGLCLDAGASFENGAQMRFADLDNKIYFMELNDAAVSKLWVDGEDYTVDIEYKYGKDITIYTGDYDQDGDNEYLLTAYNPVSGEIREWYLIELKEDGSTEAKKIDQNSCITFGEGKEYILDAGANTKIFSDGEKVYPLIDKSGKFGLSVRNLPVASPDAHYKAAIYQGDLDGDKESEYALTYSYVNASDAEPEQDDTLAVIEIRNDKAEVFVCPDTADNEQVETIKNRLCEYGNAIVDMSRPLTFMMNGHEISYFMDVLIEGGEEKTSTGEVTYHKDGTFGFDEEKEKNGRFPKRVTLSGNHDDHLVTEGFSFVEGDKFVLLLDKDVDLPGDFADNVALIIDEIEKTVGLTFAIDKPLYGFDNSTVSYGFNPWEDFSFGQKVPICIKVDRDDAGYISWAATEVATIFDYRLFSTDLWNSIPGYRDNAWRRYDYVDYYQIAHELTHVLTLRHTELTKIMTEGSADYVAEKVINALVPVSADFAGNLEIMSYNLGNCVKNDVTPENAEEVFRNDYKDVSHADREDEYTLGRMICSFLEESYGESFLRDYIAALQKAGYVLYSEKYFNITDTERDEQTEIFKKVFGKDALKDFGTYYQTHKSE